MSLNTKDGINILSLFDGISGGRVSFDRANIKVNNYYASEVDPYAIKVAKANYPSTIEIGDVRNINGCDYKDIDILIGGSPCQSFSFAGKRNGMTTKESKEVTTLEQYLALKKDGFEFEGYSYLFWEYVRVLKEVKPKYFLLENVKMSEKWKNVITEALGVEPIMINSNLVSGQNRKRLYWTNIPNVIQPADRHIYMRDVIKKNRIDLRPVGDWVYQPFSKKVGKQIPKIDTLYTLNAKKSHTLTTSKTHSMNYYVTDDRKMYSNLDAEEAEILQTLPVGYTKGIPEGKRFKAIGNGWTIDVIVHIISNLKNV